MNLIVQLNLEVSHEGSWNLIKGSCFKHSLNFKCCKGGEVVHIFESPKKDKIIHKLCANCGEGELK